MVTTFTEILNSFNQWGGFSYVIPFILIFAVVFAILQKTKILGPNKTIQAIIAVAIGLIALLNDHVPRFFAVIFPRFGIGLAVFLVLIIFLGFFFHDRDGKANPALQWIGWLVGIGVVVWALSEWDEWGNWSGFGGWFAENIWALIVLGVIVGVVIFVAKSGKEPGTTPGTS